MGGILACREEILVTRSFSSLTTTMAALAETKPVYMTVYPNTFNARALTLQPGEHGTYFVTGLNGERLRFNVKTVVFKWGRDASKFGGPDTAVIDIEDDASVTMMNQLEEWYLQMVTKLHAKKKNRRSAPKPVMSKFKNYRVKLHPKGTGAMTIDRGMTADSVSLSACLWSPDKPRDDIACTDSLSLTAMFINE